MRALLQAHGLEWDEKYGWDGGRGEFASSGGPALESVFLPVRVPRLAAGATFWRSSGAGSEGRRSCWVLALRVPKLAASGLSRQAG